MTQEDPPVPDVFPALNEYLIKLGKWCQRGHAYPANNDLIFDDSPKGKSVRLNPTILADLETPPAT